MAKKSLNLSFTSQDILNKQFKPSKSGYDSYEVDEYLDKIIDDYRLVESNYLMSKTEIDNIKKRLNDLKIENDKLQILVSSYKNKIGDFNSNGINGSNIDLLKRIDKMEKFLWKQGFDPNKIK